MRHRPFFSLLFVLLFSVAAILPASAHHLPPGMEDVDEFAEQASFLIGFNHPLSGLDHLAIALLTGWLAARLTGLARVVLIPGAMFALTGGACMAASGLKLPAVEAMLASSVVLSAVVITFQSVRPLRVGAAALVLFQIWQGNAHALEAPSRAVPGLYFSGVCAATALAMILGFSLALLAKRHLPGVLTGVQPA
ncbi:MAG TPA: HupE/UreJ family protein [Verrucomicrobiales bacterium]|jgi:urease accessory protein|nr:HupE/UreJ family protein [Verrucomicrobiales bacterium]